MHKTFLLSLLSFFWTSSSALPADIISAPAGPLFVNFADVLCSDDVVGDPHGDPGLRWSEAGTDRAWDAVSRFWHEDPTSRGLNFVQAVSHYWHGPEQWDCGKMGSDPCGAGPGSCGDKTGRGDTTTPAAWLILQSFTTIHNFQYNQYQAAVVAEVAVLAEVGNFASTFVPIEDKTAETKLLLDILGLWAAVLSSGIWNKILKDSTLFANHPNDHGLWKDIANAAISNAMTIAKDTLPSVQSILSAQNNLSDYVGTLVATWRKVITTHTQQLFSGDRTDLLYDQIKQGKCLNIALTSTGLYDMELIMKKTIFGILIPKAWQSSNSGVYPVILSPKGDITGCIGNPNVPFITDEVAARSSACLPDNRAYYLFNVGGGPCAQPHGGNIPLPCPYQPISELKGVGSLDGTSWGGVLRSDIILSAVSAYRINGNKNGYVMPELSMVRDDANSMGELYFEAGITTPGLVTIPVCDFTVVLRNWQKYGNSGEKPVGYPCNE